MSRSGRRRRISSTWCPAIISSASRSAMTGCTRNCPKRNVSGSPVFWGGKPRNSSTRSGRSASGGGISISKTTPIPTPADAGSRAGAAYAGYGGEYLLKYTLLAREVFGKDYTGTPWMRNYASYMVHGLLPVRTADEWAMTYGDAPRRATTSTAQHLFVLAGFYRDPVAQRMARLTIQLKPQGLGSHGWMMLLYYDPTVGEADLAILPTFKFFPEIGQTMMRSSWTDPDAMLVGFKCGPFMGMTLSPKAVFDFGTGHAATDAGSFQIFAEGKYWAVHPLYPGYKLTEDYNTLLFKGVGQLGEQPGFGAAEALYFKHYPQIVYTESASGCAVVRRDR